MLRVNVMSGCAAVANGCDPGEPHHRVTQSDSSALKGRHIAKTERMRLTPAVAGSKSRRRRGGLSAQKSLVRLHARRCEQAQLEAGEFFPMISSAGVSFTAPITDHCSPYTLTVCLNYNLDHLAKDWVHCILNCKLPNERSRDE